MCSSRPQSFPNPRPAHSLPLSITLPAQRASWGLPFGSGDPTSPRLPPAYLRHCKHRSAYCRSHFLLRPSKRSTAQHTPPHRSAFLAKPRPGAVWAAKADPSRRGNLHSFNKKKKKQPQSNNNKKTPPTSCIYLFFQEESCSLCMCVCVRTIGKKTVQWSCQETVSHLPAWRAVFPFLLYQKECSREPPSPSACAREEI